MGAIAALLALGGIVALAAYSAGSDEAPPLGATPPAGAPPALPPPSPVMFNPPAGGTQTAVVPTGGGHADPYAATPVPSHCPPGTNMADPTARALCGPAPGAASAPPVVPVSSPAPAPSSPAPGAAPAPAVPPDLVERVRAFLASDPSPERIEELAVQLERAGMAEPARELRRVASIRRERAAAATPGAAPAPSPSPAPSPAPSATPGPAPGPPSPAGTPEPSSSSATAPGSSSSPGGSAATRSGPQLAEHTASVLSARLQEIQRLAAAFQTAAGIDADGQYGPITQAALAFWSGRSAPRPWVGSGRASYRTVLERGGSSAVASRAERAARALFAALLNPEGDARPALEHFQRAVGLTADGKYGRRSRAALVRMGVASPPRAFRRSRARRSSRRRSA